jgi:hypothetical protein
MKLAPAADNFHQVLPYHSGIGLLSPGTVHYVKAESALIKRQHVLETAYAARP